MTHWRSVGLAIALAGLIDSLYLTADSLDARVPLYCPSAGIVNCATLTASTFSRLDGVPVAVLGATWFGLMVMVLAINHESLNYALIPLWAMGVVGVGYLVFTELFVVNAICPYCTLAHVLGISLIIPAAKLVFAD